MDIIIGLSIFALLAALYFGYKELEKRYYDYEVPAWETILKGIKDIPEMLAKYREAGLSLLK